MQQEQLMKMLNFGPRPQPRGHEGEKNPSFFLHDVLLIFSFNIYITGLENEIWKLIAAASREGSGKSEQMCRLTARVFTACIHKVWKQMKTQTKI